MSEMITLNVVIKDPIELNLSYMPFIHGGGLFIPTPQPFSLGDKVLVNLQLPGKNDSLKIEGKIVWITPKIALYHVIPGIGIQFIGSNPKSISSQIEAQLDASIEVGGYTYGITEETKREKNNR